MAAQAATASDQAQGRLPGSRGQRRGDHKLHSVSGREFAQQVRDVGLDRLHGDGQVSGDLVIGQALPDEGKYLDLPSCQPVQPGPYDGSGGGGVPSGDIVLDRARQDRGSEE